MTKNLPSKIKAQLGFTMIELLVVIAILGILAVAVLSAINPIEQINRGRDTQSRSDAEQMINAIDRYNAFQEYYPWQLDSNEGFALYYDAGEAEPVPIGADAPCVDGTGGEDRTQSCVDGDADYGCSMMDRLSIGDNNVANVPCVGSDELKSSFLTRVTDPSSRTLYIYNRGEPGDSSYVCFIPQSGAFRQEAEERCTGPGLPSDIDAAGAAFICATDDSREAGSNDTAPDYDTPMICLP